MASSLVVVVKVVVVTVVVVLVTEVVVSSGISATFTQGVAKIGVSNDFSWSSNQWFCSVSPLIGRKRAQVSINLKPLLNFPSKVSPLQ